LATEAEIEDKVDEVVELATDFGDDSSHLSPEESMEFYEMLADDFRMKATTLREDITNK